MNGKLVLVTFFSLITNSILGQQESYLTHFNFNKVLFNPAYAGYDGNWCANLFHHRQWIGLKDHTGRFQTEDHLPPSPQFPSNIAPVTQGLGMAMPINRGRDHDQENVGGVYLGFIDDVIAYEKNTSFKAGLAWNIRIGERSHLRVGMDANYHSKRFDALMLRALQNPDPLVPSGASPADSKILIGSGVYFSTTRHSFFAGFSMSSWNQPEFRYANNGGGITGIQAARHAYLISGATFWRSDYKIQPVILLKSTRDRAGWVKPQLDAQCNVTYKNIFSAGLNLRGQVAGVDACSMLLGFYPGEIWRSLQPAQGSFRIGYSYDITLQALRLSSRNTHEIQVNYCFFISRPFREIDHPRDLKNHEKAQVVDKRRR